MLSVFVVHFYSQSSDCRSSEEFDRARVPILFMPRLGRAVRIRQCIIFQYYINDGERRTQDAGERERKRLHRITHG